VGKGSMFAALGAVLAVAAGIVVLALVRGGAREEVRVVGGPAGWRFEHHGLVETDTLTVPGGVKVAFHATSSDIPRTLWFPSLKFFRRLYPGEEATFTLTFPQDRLTTSGACSVGCGGTRSGTQFDVEVLTREDFKAWVKASH
jgi:heme/copper-type cytochrome/quinol oxidase subunit 2